MTGDRRTCFGSLGSLSKGSVPKEHYRLLNDTVLASERVRPPPAAPGIVAPLSVDDEAVLVLAGGHPGTQTPGSVLALFHLPCLLAPPSEIPGQEHFGSFWGIQREGDPPRLACCRRPECCGLLPTSHDFFLLRYDGTNGYHAGQLLRDFIVQIIEMQRLCQRFKFSRAGSLSMG